MSSNGLNDVFIVSVARTPIGSMRGSLSSLTAPKLGSIAVKAALERAGITGDDVDECIFGNALQAGIGQAPARQAALGGGIALHTPCTTVNKICSSGMKAIMFGAQSIRSGDNEVVIAGGMESMSNVPMYQPRGDTPFGGFAVIDGIVKDGITDVYTQLNGVMRTENLAKKSGITRAAQDAWAIKSYKNAARSAPAGIFAAQIVPVTITGKKGRPDVTVTEDEEYKKVDFEKLLSLAPVAKENGTITAANTGAISDGGAATVLMSASAVKKFGAKPLAKIVAFADAALEPIDFGIAPALAVLKILEKTGIKKSEISHWEINEPFSVVPLAIIKHLDIDPEKVNPNGGAVALGHPLGFSGTRIVNHLALHLKPGQYGMAGICNGGGGGSALLVQKL